MIKKLIPEATETMAYGIPTFKTKENLVHFAAYKTHIGFYPTPPVLKAFKTEIVQFKNAKGSVQFPLSKPIPYELISKMVKYRIELLQ